MSKMLDATCSAGVVQVNGLPVDDCEILSEGIGQSAGIILMEGLVSRYVPSTASDLKDTLTEVIAALTEIANVLTAIGGGMTGPTTAPPPTLPASVITINAKVTLLTTLKGALK